MTEDSRLADEETERARVQTWIKQARGLHHNKRMAGFAGIIAGAGILLWWKFTPAAPDWALWVGGGLLALSWAVFIYVIIDRYNWVKKNPYGSESEK